MNGIEQRLVYVDRFTVRLSNCDVLGYIVLERGLFGSTQRSNLFLASRVTSALSAAV